MPWRLIQFIVIFVVLVVLVAFNLGDSNKCDISFGFATIKDVPVFLTAFSAFILGMLCVLPYIIKLRIKGKAGRPDSGIDKNRSKTRKAGKSEIPDLPDDSSLSDGGTYGID